MSGTLSSPARKGGRTASTAVVAPKQPTPLAAAAGSKRKSTPNRSVADATAGDDVAAVETMADPTPTVREKPARKRQRSASLPTPPVQPANEHMNEYERLRAERIAANQQRLLALNIDKLSAVIHSNVEKKQTVRGLSTAGKSRRRAASNVEPRKSLRVQGMAPDGTMAAGIADERRDGTVVLASGGTFAVPEAPQKTRPVGDLPFKSLNGKPESDATFLSTLRSDSECVPAVPCMVTAAELKRLSLAERDVAKVCPRGVTHMDFMPGEDGLLVVAAGDKEGNVGIFFPDATPADAKENQPMEVEEDDDDDGAADGVLLTKPFGQYVSGIKWAKQGTQRLFACSYDGSVRTLDVAAGQWLESYVSKEEEFSSFDVTPCGTTAYVADNDGGVTIVDMRAGTRATGPEFSAHYERVNCTSLAPQGGLLATSASDRTCCIWDIRKGLSRGAKPLHRLQHGKSCHGAYWAPQGPARLLTTSYDDTLNVWSADGQLNVRIKHNNQTGKWLLPFRAIWTPSGDGVVVGSMQRETEIFSAANGACLAKHRSDYLTAIPTRHASHASGNAIAAGTASGRVHIWRLNN